MDNFNKENLHHLIDSVLIEDIGTGDYTSEATITAGVTGSAKLLVKEEGILAGVDLARLIFSKIDPGLKFESILKDGEAVSHADLAFKVHGSVHSILKGERVVLNLMQRMSGIASATNQVVRSLEGTGCKVLDTRKTTPGLRMLEKYAVTLGGGVNHRFGLYDMILIKDNHVDYAGGITAALEATYTYLKQHNLQIPVELEVRDQQELEEALEFGRIDRLLIDNFSVADLNLAVQTVGKRVKTEASGNITPQNAADYARTGVDYLSMGALTHSVKSLDMSLKAL